MVVDFIAKNEKGKMQVVKTLNLDVIPDKNTFVRVGHVNYVIRTIVFDVNNVKYLVYINKSVV